MQLRRHAPFLAILAAAACMRLWALGWLPSPAGDEGNWTTYGLQILRGEPAALDQNAAFVSMLYAHLIAGLMALFGPGFFASRVVNALAVLAAVIASYAVVTRMAPRRPSGGGGKRGECPEKKAPSSRDRRRAGVCDIPIDGRRAPRPQ